MWSCIALVLSVSALCAAAEPTPDGLQSPIALSNLPGAQIYRIRQPFYTPNEWVSGYAYDDATKNFDIPEATAVFVERNQERYRLAQFHFHLPGEHIIDGRTFALELHLVLVDLVNEDEFVIGLVIEHAGDLYKPVEWSSPLLQSIVDSQPFLLPSLSSYWSYMGSLTTPPLTHSVAWMIGQRPLVVSASDYRFFKAHSKPEREIQPRAGRDIVLAYSAGGCRSGSLRGCM